MTRTLRSSASRRAQRITCLDPTKSFSNIIRATHTFEDDRYVGVSAPIAATPITDRIPSMVLTCDIDCMRMSRSMVSSCLAIRATGSSSQHNPGTFDAGRHTVEFDGETFNGNRTSSRLNVIRRLRYSSRIRSNESKLSRRRWIRYEEQLP